LSAESHPTQLVLEDMTDAPTQAVLGEIEEVATRIAKEAGVVLMDRFRTALEIEYKDSGKTDPVTEVDRTVEKLVHDSVVDHFPEHAILGEEGADTNPDGSDFVWVVDPLDGTSNFINGLAVFACSIGVLWRGIPVVGAVFMPTNRHMQPGVYHGRLGGGVYFEEEQLHFHTAEAPPSARLSGMPGGTSGVTGPKGRRFGIARTLGSIAAELVCTAEGTFQMALFEGGKIWDLAGGVALCLEAGASVYVRSGKGAQWRPIERFAGSDAEPPTTAQLRAWNQGVTVGAAEVLPDLARDLQKEQGPFAVLRRLLLREGGG